jgi:transposase-like protein
LDELFEGRLFDRGIIVLCVRWYLRFKLNCWDLLEMMAERGLSIAHTTIIRWVHDYAPEFEHRWNRFAQPAGASWRVDETYVKVRGEWVYLYWPVDRAADTVEFRLSPRRDVAAAKAFFRKAIKGQGSGPRTVTLDGYAASHRAVRKMKTDGELPVDTRLRSSKDLNNLIEQDHRAVKQRVGPMLGFADSDEISRRFRLKPATCSDGSQPGIPKKPVGVAERTASGWHGVSSRMSRQACWLWRPGACGEIPHGVPSGARCGPTGRGRHRRWWDRRYEHASSRPAVGW